MADVRFAPPLLGLSSPPGGTPMPPPPPGGVSTAAPAAPRLSPPSAPWTRENTGAPALSFQDLIQPSKLDTRTPKRRKKRVRKVLSYLLLFGLLGGVGYYVRNTSPVQRLLGHDKP